VRLKCRSRGARDRKRSRELGDGIDVGDPRVDGLQALRQAAHGVGGRLDEPVVYPLVGSEGLDRAEKSSGRLNAHQAVPVRHTHVSESPLQQLRSLLQGVIRLESVVLLLSIRVARRHLQRCTVQLLVSSLAWLSTNVRFRSRLTGGGFSSARCSRRRFGLERGASDAGPRTPRKSRLCTSTVRRAIDARAACLPRVP